MYINQLHFKNLNYYYIKQDSLYFFYNFFLEKLVSAETPTTLFLKYDFYSAIQRIDWPILRPPVVTLGRLGAALPKFVLTK